MAPPISVPFDLAAAMARGVDCPLQAWPQHPLSERAGQKALFAAFHQWLVGLEGDARDVALLAFPYLMSRLASLFSAAGMVHDAAGRFEMVGGPPELAFLQAGEGEPPNSKLPLHSLEGKVRALALRALARTASWTSPARLPATLLAPQVVAISHNCLLRQRAAKNRVRFHQAERLLQKAREAVPGRALDVDLAALSKSAVGLARMDSLDPAVQARLDELVRVYAGPVLARAAADLAGFGALRRLPTTVWSGTGGYYPSRAVGLAALRRGGQAVRFGHGGGAGMFSDVEPILYGEMAVSSAYVVGTPAVAANLRGQGVEAAVAPIRPCRLEASTEPNPAFAHLPRLERGPGGARPKVIYPSTCFTGFRRTIPPQLHDAVYLDWQLRFARQLMGLPIDLLCKPHPEGELWRRRHPLAEVAPTSTARFEQVMDQADVFVFDYPMSTTFWEALTTHRPVVLVDFGVAEPSPAVADALARRCRIVKARYGADNLPRVDEEELRDAILGAPAAVDPGEFRRMLVGEQG